MSKWTIPRISLSHISDRVSPPAEHLRTTITNQSSTFSRCSRSRQNICQNFWNWDSCENYPLLSYGKLTCWINWLEQRTETWTCEIKTLFQKILNNKLLHKCNSIFFIQASVWSYSTQFVVTRLTLDIKKFEKLKVLQKSFCISFFINRVYVNVLWLIRRN